ncbi:hypothetical protein ACFXG1_08730 [Streptomyces sp. NPDC059248]|uniref:hypothetical protein n=1 Tax=Streptomyces sp. NPDC059248 TaxID=3346791 RepID=UPI0036B4BCED
MLKSRIAGVLAAAVAAFGLTLVTAPSASAIEGVWKPWNNGWVTECGTTKTHRITTNASFQACFIIGSGSYVQPVLVVKNNTTSAIRLKGSADSTYGTTVNCPDTFLSAGQRTTCMGTTEGIRLGLNLGWGDLDLMSNGAWHGDRTAYVPIQGV